MLDWIKENQPDIIGLQEIKCLSENFPSLEFEELGYNVKIFGQKSFNGVALLSKKPFDEIKYGFNGIDSGEQARLIEGVFSTKSGAIRVCNIYLPNGNPVDSDKFTYKLDWFDDLIEYAKERLAFEEPFIIMGDYNIIPSEIDVYDAKSWWGDALFCQESLDKFRQLQNLGFIDAIRALSDEPNYSFWDFQRGAWRKNHGLRIDHIMLSAQAADLLLSSKTHKEVRGYERPSDHVPVEAVFELE